MYKKQFAIIKKVLGINNIVSIRFSDTKTAKFKKYKDTVCTALVRSLKSKIPTYIDRLVGQLCSGGNYFLGITHSSKKEICDVYVKDEHVFQNNSVCHKFLGYLPKYPAVAMKKYILITPLTKETKPPHVILLLATPAQVGRILGLCVFKNYKLLYILPAGPTCVSLFTSLTTNGVHLNFIDYYDRHRQCVKGGVSAFNDEEMIVALPYKLFNGIIECVEKSPHGSFEPDLKPAKVSRL